MSDLTANLADHLQPPMENGEVLFNAPWESRTFAMAVALHESGVFPWPMFQAQFIAEIETWEAHHSEGVYPYFELFGQALQVVLEAQELVASPELSHRVDALAARPHGHDHHH